MGKDMKCKVVQRAVLLRESEDDDDTVEVLVLRNPDGTWELPGGKIDEKESAFGSLRREVAEETGLTVTAADPVATMVRKHKKTKPRGKFGVVYRCAFAGDDVEISDEHVDFAWLSRARVEETNLAQIDEYRALLRVIDDAEDDETESTIEWRPERTNGERPH